MSKYAKEVNKCLTKIKRGDASQYEILFDLTWNHLSVVAKHYLNNTFHSDDVVMEAYERVMKYISSYKEGLDGYNWLCKITEMVAYSYNKKEAVFDNAKTIESDEASDDFTESIELKTDLDNIIDRLDSESRTVIICYFYLDMTYEEIGKRVGKTKSAICKQIKSLLKEIKDST